MDILKGKIVEFLKKSKCAKSFDILVKEFKIKSDDDKNLLKECLKDLEREAILYENKNHNYILLEYDKKALVGTVKICDNGDAHVFGNDGRIVTVLKEQFNDIFNNDIVLVENLCHSDNKIYGTIKKVIKRKLGTLACVVLITSTGEKEVYPYQSDNKEKITIDQKYLDDFIDGEIVLINLDSLKNKKGPNITKTNRHKDEPADDIFAIAYNNGFKPDYSDKYMKELDELINSSKNSDKNRVDLRNLETFTIDGKDTKDMDDAISLIKLENGNYKLYVHIADVSHFIKFGSEIFNRAYNMGTSVYMNDTVIHMFHRLISNGLCSLNPNSDRLTKTCEMTFSKEGKLLDSKIYKSIINSNKKMNYDDVNLILEKNIIPEGYEKYKYTLLKMNELSEIMNETKKERGYINFDIIQLKLKGLKEHLSITPTKQGKAEKLIENFMLAANESVATYVAYMSLPFIYRIHEKPDQELIRKAIVIFNNLGFKFKNCQNLDSNKYIQNVIEKISDKDNLYVLSEILLRGLKKARYDDQNLGHFGLALKFYTHFTSPIRRLTDLLVHMLLDYYLEGKVPNIDNLEEYISKAATHASEKERAADKCEKESNLMRMAEYMEDHIGEKFEAVITNIDNHSITIRTDNFFIGKISLNDLEDDYYLFDEKGHFLIGRKTHNIYKIGDKISTTVKDASKINRTINFKVIEKINKKQKVLRIS